MGIHNESFDFSRVQQQDRLAFAFPPRREMLESGRRLYRFLTHYVHPSGRYNSLLESPWWFGRQTFDQLLGAASSLGASITSVARSRLAIAEGFNPSMSEFCVIQLTHPTWAWIGPTRHQQRSAASPHVLLMGGLEQIYLPNLSTGGQDAASSIAVILYHGSPNW